MTPSSDFPPSGGRGPQRRGPGGGGRNFDRPAPRGFGRGPGAGPARGPGGGFGQGRPYSARPPYQGEGGGYGRPNSGGGRGYGDGGGAGAGGEGRPFRPRVSFRPDGSQKAFDQPRPPRPGRLEREAIRSGQRPFYRRPAGPGAQGGPGGDAEGYGGQRGYGYGGGPSRGPQSRPDFRDRSAPAPRGPYRRPDDGFEGNDDQPWGGARAPQAPRGERRGFRGPGGPRPERFGDGPRRGPARPERSPAGPAFERAEPAAAPDTERSNLELAAMIVEKATARIPADLLLRQTLARRKRLTRGDSAWISRAVFSFYRWQNWLPTDVPLPRRIQGALELADRFAANPEEVDAGELAERALPAWPAEQLAVTPAWVRSLQADPVLWLRARKSVVADLARQLPGAQPSGFGRFPEAFRYQGDEDLFRHDLFQSGGFEIQDIASQAVGILCAPTPEETWWDACAGEGGKTLHLSDLMDGKGLIWATDRSQWRLDRLKLRAGRAGCFNYRSRAWDGTEKLPTNTLFDGILVDAPCSGVGTWGRNPHSRWTVQPQDVTELAVIQKQIVHHALAALKPGGRLIYAVCTLTRAETFEVAEAITAQHPELEPLLLENPFNPAKVPTTALTLWPQETGGNGMFLAGWRRKV